MNILIDIAIGFCAGFSLYMLLSTSEDNQSKLRFFLYMLGWTGAITLAAFRLGFIR